MRDVCVLACDQGDFYLDSPVGLETDCFSLCITGTLIRLCLGLGICHGFLQHREGCILSVLRVSFSLMDLVGRKLGWWNYFTRMYAKEHFFCSLA